MSATQNEPVRVLHVFGTMDRGGAEMRTLELMRALDPTAVTTQFLTLSGRAGALDQTIEQLGGTIHPCPLGTSFSRRFREVVEREQIDVVHSHVFDFSGFILREAARHGVRRRIAHYRSTSDGRASTPRRRLQRSVMRRWVRAHATSILAVSESAMAASMGPQWTQDPRCEVVYNGLDLGPFTAARDREGVLAELGLPQDARLVLHVGNQTAAKNHSRVLTVFGELLKQDASVRLLLVGAGTGLSALAATLPPGTALALGERHDVPRLMLAADVLLAPSVREGLPGAVLEACAAGLPVVATDLPGTKEIARHFEAVTCLSLDTDDKEWALRLRMALEVPDAEQRTRLRRFETSPFDLNAAIDRMSAHWGAHVDG